MARATAGGAGRRHARRSRYSAGAPGGNRGLVDQGGRQHRIKAQLEWNSVHAVLLEAAAQPYMVEGRIAPADMPGKESRVYRKPVGVVGVISPFNFPLQLSARSIAPALAVGNAVVLKPASDTPVTGGLLMGKIFEEAGLPPGVLSVIVGAGREIGDPFVTHAIPRVISFTGSTPVGRHIAELTAQAGILKRLELELGGNTPFVILDDADLERAIEAAVFGKFLHQGQICMAVNRFIVDAAVYDDFVDQFSQRVRELKVGDPDDPQTMIGPIINRKQLEGLMHRIQQARQSGLRQTVGGEPDGLVLPPHVFAGVANDHPIAREELFGPVAPIIRAGSEGEACAWPMKRTRDCRAASLRAIWRAGRALRSRSKQVWRTSTTSRSTICPSIHSAARKTRASGASTGAGRSTLSPPISG